MVAERPDNIFSTGKIRLNLNDRKPVITENEYLFEPGMTVDKPFFLKNEGADCWYRLYFNNVSGSLSSVLEVTVSDGETVLFTGKMSDLTQSSADWLGILPAVQSSTHSVAVDENDMVIQFTDGLADACGGMRALEGQVQLFMRDRLHRSPETLCTALMSAAMRRCGGVPQDDLTVCCTLFKRRKSQKRECSE